MTEDNTPEVIDDVAAESDPFESEPAAASQAETETPVVAPAVELALPVTSRYLPTDEEIQEAVSKIALGIQVRVRSTNGEVTDTFVAGGDYAPGRQRWVQTHAYASADAQALEIAASLQ